MLPSNTARPMGRGGRAQCHQSNNAEPMLRKTKSSELIREIQPADLRADKYFT